MAKRPNRVQAPTKTQKKAVAKAAGKPPPPELPERPRKGRIRTTARAQISFTYEQRDQVAKLAMKGVSQREVAKVLGCSRTTLLKHFADLFPENSRKKGPERPATTNEKDMVAGMAAMGLDDTEIGYILRQTPTQVGEKYRAEINSARPEANARVAAALFNEAVNGNVQAAKFWLEAMAGWRSRVDVRGRVAHDHSGQVDVQQTVQHELRGAVVQLDEKGLGALREVLSQLGARSIIEDSARDGAEAMH